MIKKFFRGRRKKNNWVVAIIGILVCLITVGFAAITSSLKINGTIELANSSWDIHFENIRVKDGSVAATQEATISNKTTLSFAAPLTRSGDFYEFDVDVVNAGSINAKLKEITKLPVLTTEQQNYLEYTVTYQNGSEVKVNDALKSGERFTLTVRIKYKNGLTDAELPINSPKLNVSYTLIYDQDDGTGIEVDKSIDSVNLENATTGKLQK